MFFEIYICVVLWYLYWGFVCFCSLISAKKRRWMQLRCYSDECRTKQSGTFFHLSFIVCISINGNKRNVVELKRACRTRDRGLVAHSAIVQFYLRGLCFICGKLLLPVRVWTKCVGPDAVHVRAVKWAPQRSLTENTILYSILANHYHKGHRVRAEYLCRGLSVSTREVNLHSYAIKAHRVHDSDLVRLVKV